MTQQELQRTIARIEKMEWCFDTVVAAFRKDAAAAKASPVCRALLAALLPPTLKRGVLSEDGVYNFLTEWEEEN